VGNLIRLQVLAFVDDGQDFDMRGFTLAADFVEVLGAVPVA
jgi:hypothetical protein